MRSRRTGTRSASDSSSAPPTTYGSIPAANTSAAAAGEPVRSNACTDSAIVRTESPPTWSVWRENRIRNSATPNTSR
ncbi:hypothetical protein LUX33_36025 [Actinomadura madurae]|nr:hypothetical protein [Actinomadura madurae]MCP9953313.1 hypothetical protein [Actinomadura madurae]MCP9970072.1 hypothetical protein [Actinomadura madurae]MCP9982531.1 hypothetical protein [Actinomadura madurae]